MRRSDGFRGELRVGEGAAPRQVIRTRAGEPSDEMVALVLCDDLNPGPGPMIPSKYSPSPHYRFCRPRVSTFGVDTLLATALCRHRNGPPH